MPLERFFRFLDQAKAPKSTETLDGSDMAEITRLWEESHPSDNFGMLEAISVTTAFRVQYMLELRLGYEEAGRGVDAFVAQTIQEQGKVPYIIHEAADSLDSKQLPVHTFHQSEALGETLVKLGDLYRFVENAAVPAAVKEAYLEKCEQWILFCKTALVVSTPEFTVQQNKTRLEALIDFKKTAARDEVTLKYEDDAFNVLVIAKNKRKKQEQAATSPTEASEPVRSKLLPRGITFWKFTDEELQPALSLEKLQTLKEVGAEDIAHLFKVLFIRVGLEGEWQVEISPTAVAITINGEAKKVKVPASDTFSIDEIGYLLAHEFVHILRGENGSRQIIKLLQGGTEGYEISDEGLALLAELLAGEPFGHDRQVKMAARYYAIALSLKTKTVDDTEVAAYSAQEIYNIIREYGVHHKDASDIVWRINRGTSCTRQTTTAQLATPTELVSVALAETFFKDTIYFEGQMALFNFFKDLLPVHEEDRTNEKYQNIRDFNRSLLLRVGRALLGKGIDINQTQASQENIEQTNLYTRAMIAMAVGRDAILELMDYFMVGKIPFEKLAAEDSPWHQAIQRDNLITYRNLLQGNRPKA
jgi:hypothetical protein